MQLSPEKIYNKFLRNEIDRTYSISLLISLLNHSQAENPREKAFSLLHEIHPKNNSYYDLNEHLYLSDPNSKIRFKALNIILKNFSEISLNLLNWGLQNEENFENQLLIIEHLMKIQCKKSKSILIHKINQIYERSELNKNSFQLNDLK